VLLQLLKLCLWHNTAFLLFQAADNTTKNEVSWLKSAIAKQETRFSDQLKVSVIVYQTSKFGFARNC